MPETPIPKELRFGVRRDDNYSQYWKVSITQRDEVYVSSQRTGSFLHTSFHAAPEHWHIKVRGANGQTVKRIDVPAYVLPGTRRILRVHVPIAVLTYPRPRGADRVVWVGPQSDAEHWISFTILLSDAAAPTVVGADTLGTLPLRDGRTITVISQEVVGGGSEHTFPASLDEIDNIRTRVARGGARAIIAGLSEPDGCVWFLELVAAPSDPEVDSRPDPPGV